MSTPPAQRRILIVDDDSRSRDLCREVLTPLLAEGSIIEEATSGEEAVALLRQASYAVIIADYRMGFMNGIDVLEIALRDSPTTLRILTTGMRDLALAQEALSRARVGGFVTKAQTITEMRATFASILAPSDSPPS